PSYLHMQTHPDRLATMATFFGMQPAPVERCRVLELGCNDGGNLIPYAFSLPESSFVGIDLAARPIKRGQEMVADLGLKNIELRRFDVMEVDESFGEFDYIIAHGLYSWVPPFVRDKILEICRANLSPQGVAYVSYNAYPGCHLRDMTREMMLFHTQNVTDPEEKIVQAMALLKFLADSFAEPDLYRMFLQKELEHVLERRREQMFHDDMAEFNQPYYFYQFAREAAAHGLQFLSEADFFEMQDHLYTPQVKEALKIMSSDIIAREQYLDFVRCRRFRQTLLCHKDVQLNRQIKPERLRGFYIASSARAVSEKPDVTGGAVEEFQGAKGAVMKTDHPVAKAAIICLGEAHPQSLGFQELLERALERSGNALATNEAERERDALVLGDILLKVYAAGLVELHVHQQQLATVAGARPIASQLARWQIAQGAVVTTLLCTGLEIEDAFGQKLLRLLDGTRDRADLLRELSGLVESGELELEDKSEASKQNFLDNLPQLLEDSLARFAKLGILLA
ncbi:MAG: methyltransferase regulatory domain-containing protein, partial [Acidobacteria bacterium]|nr:methyltransferase regulatory domain-containing protein [Acidobacteriota bacterium]